MSELFGHPDCRMVQERLAEVRLEDIPDGEERAALAAHLETCADCREWAKASDRMARALSAVAASPLPARPGNWDDLCARLEATPRGRNQGEIRPRRPVFGIKSLAFGVLAATMGFAAVATPWVTPGAPKAGEPAVRTASARTVAESIPVASEAASLPPALAQGVARFMGFVTAGKGGNVLGVAPAFVGGVAQGVIPLAVVVTSDGPETDAEIAVRPQMTGPERVYRYRVRLAGQGLSRFVVYPMLKKGQNSEFPNYQMACEVTLTTRHRRQTLYVPLGRENVATAGRDAIACITNRLGAITPRYSRNDGNDSPISTNRLNPLYVAPEFAPDRAIGYGDLQLLVLTEDAASLTPAQWNAIREWVTAGGHLMITRTELLDIPTVAQMAPVRKGFSGGNVIAEPGATTKEVASPSIQSALSMQSDLPEGLRLLKTLTVGHWGLGTVLFTSFDPTTEAFRSWYGSESFWQDRLIERVNFRPLPSAEYHSYRYDQPYAESSSSSPDDAFQMSLPSVQNVVFFFVGYFFLAVPVTFAVLKHTRRLNLAWVTGPALAVGFAGGLFLITARLYFLPMARRTGGIVSLPSGERTGRFAGYTELFFPHAGNYAVLMERADMLETSRSEGERQYPLETSAAPEGRTVAQFSVPNLAFRRLQHEQTVALPGAVTVSVQPDGDGNLTGFVDNQTGMPLTYAVLIKGVRIDSKKTPGAYQTMPVSYTLGTLLAGRTPIRLPARSYRPKNWAPNPTFAPPTAAALATPQDMTLVAHVPGGSFGPQTGRDFSASGSVTLMVGVNAHENGGKQ